MATLHEIKCINKTNRMSIHERISHVGGINSDQSKWKLTQAEAILAIKQDKWNFFVTKNGKTVSVIIAKSQFGNEYLKTEADTTEVNNLLSLPECP